MLEFHNQIINTGNSASNYAIRFNLETKDNISIGPYSNGVIWDLTAKSVSENDCILSTNSSLCSGIFAIDFDMFFSGTGYIVKNMCEKENATIILLEYTEDDVVVKSKEELVLRQCNIVFSCKQKVFLSMNNDCSLFDLMAKFQYEKNKAVYNTYAVPIRDVRESYKAFMSFFNISESRVDMLNMIVHGINAKNIAKMSRLLMLWISILKLCPLTQSPCDEFLKKIQPYYFRNLSDEEFGILTTLFGEDSTIDDLTKLRMAVLHDAEIIFTLFDKGKSDEQELQLRSSKKLYGFFEHIRMNLENVAKLVIEDMKKTI